MTGAIVSAHEQDTLADPSAGELSSACRRDGSRSTRRVVPDTEMRALRYDHHVCDLICPWVRMDLAYERERLPYLGQANSQVALAPARTRDNGELAHALASARRHLPWLRRIYVVTNGQRPPAPVLDLPGVHWLTHADIFRSRYDLPTFNSNAIEANLGFVPGLAEHFLVTCDDYLIGRPLGFDAFFAGRHRWPILRRENEAMPTRLDPADLYGQALRRTFARLAEAGVVFDRRPPAHVPTSWTRATWDEMWRRFEPELAQTSATRFRQTTDFAVNLLHAGVCVSMYARMLAVSPRHISQDVYRFVRVGAPGYDWRGELASVLRHRPDFICLNDEAGEEDEAEMQVALDEFFRAFEAAP